ncbi:MAG: IS1380 family transposase, partial [Verrucomicrobiales bacterium]|nr:IS1380 family transposase [Verrucomicrobiales bacterium]
MTNCIQQTFAFQGLGKRKVEADFRGGNVSADGGVTLLREIDLLDGLTI